MSTHKEKIERNRLLRYVIKQIKEEPRRLNMNGWVNKYSEESIKYDKSIPPCGTTACIAGWVALKDVDISKLTWIDVDKYMDEAQFIAMDALHIPHAIARTLFYVEDWPSLFRMKYSDAITFEERAKITITRINYFIRTGK
jgi:hypothetical protein